jgi:hypothetical protein
MQLSTEEVFASTVGQCDNWLGELSNMVLSAEGAALYPRPPINDISYYGLLDIGFVLHASQHLPVTFIRESLSVFRQNDQQTTHNTHSHGGRVGFLAWVAYALAGWRDGHLSAEQAITAIGIATKRVVHHFSEDPIVAEYFQILDTQAQSLDSLYLAFQGFWLRMLASHPGTAARHVANGSACAPIAGAVSASDQAPTQAAVTATTLPAAARAADTTVATH